jgi:hypothetical protein
VILRLAVAFVALPLLAPAVLPPFFGCFSGASEFEVRSYDSHLPGDVDRALGGAREITVVMEVASGEILAAKNLAFPGKQLMRPGSTRTLFVLMELLDFWNLDPKQRLICPRPLRIGACGSIAATPRSCRSSLATPWLLTFPGAADSMPQWSRNRSSRNVDK